MTVGESIIQWLYRFGNIDLDQRIATDRLEAADGSLALFKQPDTTVMEYLGGSREVKARYYILARQASQTDTDRVSSAAWMEQLERWVYSKNSAHDLPLLDDGRSCYSVGIAVGAYVMDQQETESIYQLSVVICYDERGNYE